MAEDREEWFGPREYHYRYSTDAVEYTVGHNQYRQRVPWYPSREDLPSGCRFMTANTRAAGDNDELLVLPCSWCYQGEDGMDGYLASCRRRLRELLLSQYHHHAAIAANADTVVDTLMDLLESAEASRDCLFYPGVEIIIHNHLQFGVYPFLTQESLDEMAAACPPSSSYAATARRISIDDDECSICMEAMTTTETLTMPCSHTFHRPCLGRWLNNSNNNSCPICRYQLPIH